MEDLETRQESLPYIAPPEPDFPTPVAKPARKPHARRQRSALSEFINRRAMANWCTEGPKAEFLAKSEPFWEFLVKRYFRVTTTGWERLPDGPCLVIGVHAGTWLTMDAWMLLADWWFHFREQRILHGTAHDVLMAMPGIGSMFRQGGVIPASRDTVDACLKAGHSVVIWPGGEVDSMRSWEHRYQVNLDQRKGFVRQAIRSGVPIVPVATVGGSETVFVLTEGRWLAKKLRLKKYLRSEMAPIVAGLPFGIWPEFVPSHLPLPAKITNEFLEPVFVGDDPELEHDEAYVDGIYGEVQRRIQEGVDRLAGERRWPILG